jgi:hypothetical protein
LCLTDSARREIIISVQIVEGSLAPVLASPAMLRAPSAGGKWAIRKGLGS